MKSGVIISGPSHSLCSSHSPTPEPELPKNLAMPLPKIPVTQAHKNTPPATQKIQNSKFQPIISPLEPLCNISPLENGSPCGVGFRGSGFPPSPVSTISSFPSKDELDSPSVRTGTVLPPSQTTSPGTQPGIRGLSSPGLPGGANGVPFGPHSSGGQGLNPKSEAST